MIYERIKSRLLPERSFLYFSYPQPGKQRDVGFYFPMFQNIGINESQKSRLSQLEILGRSGNLFTFQGANSRSFKLQFSFNLDHIYHYVNEVGISKIEFTDSNVREKEKWEIKTKNQINTKINYYTVATSKLKNEKVATNSFEKEFISSSFIRGTGEKIEKILSNELLNPSLPQEISKFTDFFSSPPNRSGIGQISNMRDDSVNLLILLINVIRTSTVGNSSNTSLGLPTIYLNHGTMYNNIPCVCMNYSITVDEQSNYEIFSLTPKTIKVTLELMENRTGDFGKFQPFNHVKGENLAGWECVIDQGTMDPYENYYGQPPDLLPTGGLA
jgi:hypothetical protein